MGEQSGLLGGGQLVVDGHDDRAPEEGGGGGDEPLRLVAHDDGDAIAGADAAVLQAASEGHRRTLHVAVGVASVLAPALHLDERGARLELHEGIAEQLADGGIALGRDHLRPVGRRSLGATHVLGRGRLHHTLLAITSASPPKVVTP